jgi:hypothetical protein
MYKRMRTCRNEKKRDEAKTIEISTKSFFFLHIYIYTIVYDERKSSYTTRRHTVVIRESSNTAKYGRNAHPGCSLAHITHHYIIKERHEAILTHHSIIHLSSCHKKTLFPCTISPPEVLPILHISYSIRCMMSAPIQHGKCWNSWLKRLVLLSRSVKYVIYYSYF